MGRRRVSSVAEGGAVSQYRQSRVVVGEQACPICAASAALKAGAPLGWLDQRDAARGLGYCAAKLYARLQTLRYRANREAMWRQRRAYWRSVDSQRGLFLLNW